MNNRFWNWFLIATMIFIGVGLLETNADTKVSIPCSDLKKVEKLLVNFETGCYIDPNEYYFETKVIGYEGNVTIDYLDRDDVTVELNNGNMKAQIVPNQPFHIIAGSYKSPKLKLYITNDGSMKWKYFFDGTHRWRTYTPKDIIVEPIGVIPPPTDKYIKSVVDGRTVNTLYLDGKTGIFKGRIIWGDDNPGHEYGDPFVGIVRMVWEHKATYEGYSDSNGTFKIKIPAMKPTTLQAWANDIWHKYKYPVATNGYNSYYQQDGGKIPGGWTRIYPNKEIFIKVQ